MVAKIARTFVRRVTHQKNVVRKILNLHVIRCRLGCHSCSSAWTGSISRITKSITSINLLIQPLRLSHNPLANVEFFRNCTFSSSEFDSESEHLHGYVDKAQTTKTTEKIVKLLTKNISKCRDKKLIRPGKIAHKSLQTHTYLNVLL